MATILEATTESSSLLNVDVIEEIFLRLPLKSLIRFKTMSKQWRSTIESHSFGERHLKIAERADVDHLKVITISEEERTLKSNGPRHPRFRLALPNPSFTPRPETPDTDIGFRTICLESNSRLSFTLLNFPQRFRPRIYVSENCNGLFCIHSPETQAIYVVNPATHWFRQLPPARFQVLVHEFNPTREDLRNIRSSGYNLAFVKAVDYKLVWLYNSHTSNSDASSPNEGVTKCEVFDFRANAWRYLTCTPSYRISHLQEPTSSNGSIYWITEPYNEEIKVVVFDIHTELFRLLPKINHVIASSDNPRIIHVSIVDNSLCMLIKTTRADNTKVNEIWRLNSSEDMWEKIHTIDIFSCLYGFFFWPHPVAGMYCKNENIYLLYRYGKYLHKFDSQKNSLRAIFTYLSRRNARYVESLISYI